MNEIVNDARPYRSSFRSVLLLVGSLLAVGVAAYGIFTTLDLMARERTSSPIEFSSVRAIRLDVSAGSVTLSRGSTNQVVGTRTVLRGLRKPSFNETLLADGTLVLSTNCPHFGVNCAVDYTLQVPSTSSVDGQLSGGNFTVTALSGDLNVGTSGGRVRLTDVSGAGRIDSSGGDIRITGSSGQLDLRSSGGSIAANGMTNENVTVSASGGNVTFTFTKAPRSLSIDSSGGSVTVVLPAKSPPYAVDASTSGGSRRVDIATDPKSSYRLRIASSGGDITVSNAPR
jgi:Putative adhesin